MPTKQQKHSKSVVFSTKVTPINSGLAGNDSNFTTREVETLSKPRTAKQDKPPKPIPTKVHGNMIAFNSKIRAGNKVKKELKYQNIVLVEQLLRDNRVVFVHYVKKKAVYYFVLQFEMDSQAVKFLELVANCNPKVMVRKPNKDDDDDDDDDVKTIDDGSFVLLNGDLIDEFTGSISTPSTVYDPNIDLSKRYVPRNTRASTPLHTERALSKSTSKTKNRPSSRNKRNNSSTGRQNLYSSASHMKNGIAYNTIAGTPVMETYISTGEDELDDIDTTSSSVLYYEEKKPLKVRHHSSSKADDFIDRNKIYMKDGSKYIYVGPEDEEDDLSNSVNVPRSNGNNINIHSYSDLEDNDEPLEYRKRSSRNAVQTPRGERRHSRRPKSRQLPLSEGEATKSGWHSDIIFITPDQYGGVKVSADGPVMLYTASKVNNDSDEDDYSCSVDSDSSDESENYSCTSSTLTVNDDYNHRTVVPGH